jgi:hypothetical protein
MPPVLINVYYTTRSIMTYMNHPSAGTNELWRSNAYTDLQQLQTFFENPRKHTGKGYRRKEHATRGCVKCGSFKKRNDFSKNQWAKGPDLNRCCDCVASRDGAAGGQPQRSITDSSATSDFLSARLSDLSLDTDDSCIIVNLPATLTSEYLDDHNKIQDANAKKNGSSHQKRERRQFNCPDCPKFGRGKNVFFKKVPVYKPIVKCPQCKQATRGRCKRLYPIPKKSEKGYGLFKCRGCAAKWGSSRAVANIGQQCFVCCENGKDTFVKPFRLEVVKNKPKAKNKGGILGGGPGRMKRMPKVMPLGEEEEAQFEYTPDDRRRNDRGGNDALGRDHAFEYESRGSSDFSSSSVGDSSSDNDSFVTPLGKVGVPSGYVHKCEGCKSGICKSRYLPKSIQHDVSDGNTVSTSGSVMTNSSIDKADYLDRDEDFDGFDVELEEDDWSIVT